MGPLTTSWDCLTRRAIRAYERDHAYASSAGFFPASPSSARVMLGLCSRWCAACCREANARWPAAPRCPTRSCFQSRPPPKRLEVLWSARRRASFLRSRTGYRLCYGPRVLSFWWDSHSRFKRLSFTHYSVYWDRNADKVLLALQHAEAGMTKTELSVEVFKRYALQCGDRWSAASLLHGLHMVSYGTEATGGAPL